MILFISILFQDTTFAQQARMVGFLIPSEPDLMKLPLILGANEPESKNKFITHRPENLITQECDYEILCLLVYGVSNKNDNTWYAIKTKNAKPVWVKKTENFEYKPYEAFLAEAKLEFIGNPDVVRDKPESHAIPSWLAPTPLPLGVAVSSLKKRDHYSIKAAPNGKIYPPVEVSSANIESWVVGNCHPKDKFPCEFPFYEKKDGYLRFAANKKAGSDAKAAENYKALAGGLIKYVWIKENEFQTIKITDERKQPGGMSEAPVNFLNNIRVVRNNELESSRQIGYQIWLQVEFLSDSDCESPEDVKVIGKGWIPVFKSDNSQNIKFYPRGC